MNGGAMFLEQRRGDDGRPFMVYHFTDPANERECIRRMNEGGLSIELAFQSMCQCESHICETHGNRLKPGVRRPDGSLVVFDAKAFGGAKMIGEVRDDKGQAVRAYIFTVDDTQKEFQRRVDCLVMSGEAGESERASHEARVFASMCQCGDQRCLVHGLRLKESIYKSDS